MSVVEDLANLGQWTQGSPPVRGLTTVGLGLSQSTHRAGLMKSNLPCARGKTRGSPHRGQIGEERPSRRAKLESL